MKIALIGAGGKMGVRLSTNLKGSSYSVSHVEVSEAGQERLKLATAIECVSMDAALESANAVILAVPDTAIRAVSASIVDKLDPGTLVMALDAAAPFAGHFPEREDITYFVSHPCHPPIFNDEEDAAARRDHFGGVAAKQSVVSALMQGPEEHFAIGEEIAKTIFKPILRTHRVTVHCGEILFSRLSEERKEVPVY